MFCPKATRGKALSEERALPRTPSPKDFPPYRIPPPDMPLSGRKRHAVEPPSSSLPISRLGRSDAFPSSPRRLSTAFFAASSLVPLVRKKEPAPQCDAAVIPRTVPLCQKFRRTEWSFSWRKIMRILLHYISLPLWCFCGKTACIQAVRHACDPVVRRSVMRGTTLATGTPSRTGGLPAFP